MNVRNSKPILLVEDDSVDTMTVKRALKDLKITNPLVCASNGEDALLYLTNNANSKPCVILLDLNMPKMNGIEFLKVAKADDKLKRIPVVTLTTSRDEQDKVESFKLSVAGYIVKPVDYKKFVEAIRVIELYWTLSELPDQEQEKNHENLQADTARRG
jgi:CheY-like chemotaxis protein